jgi:GntR family transcriptional regulator, histidine utilization repressor
MTNLSSSTINRYHQVKTFILDGISQGVWSCGERVPSENELVNLCSVSRMTARRALQELFNEGTLIRIKGKGSFVAEEKQQASLLEIRSIAHEIRALGSSHKAELLHAGYVKADQAIANQLQIKLQQNCAHSQLLHFQDESPLQLEYRWVNLAIASDYLNQDFKQITPSEYLTSIAPVTEAEHQVEAILGDDETRQRLKVKADEAILLLERKTWCHGKLVSYARLYHPGNRYRLGTKFKTNKPD